MSSYNIAVDRITISELDVRLLVALSDGQNVGYNLAQLAERDAAKGAKVYTANAYKTLAKLASNGMVEMMPVADGRDARRKAVYHITDLGREVAAAKLAMYQNLLQVAATRGYDV